MINSIKAAGCFIEYQNEFLILRRNPGKHQGDRWGLPGGKINKDESPSEAIIRETLEETGLRLKANNLCFLGEYPLDYENLKVQFFTFLARVNQKPEVSIQEEEVYDYKWVTIPECYELPNAMDGLYTLLEKTGFLKQGDFNSINCERHVQLKKVFKE